MSWGDLTPIAGLILAIAGLGAQIDAWRQRRQKAVTGDRKAALEELGFVIDQLKEEIVRSTERAEREAIRADGLEEALARCRAAQRLLGGTAGG